MSCGRIRTHDHRISNQAPYVPHRATQVLFTFVKDVRSTVLLNDIKRCTCPHKCDSQMKYIKINISFKFV